MAGIDSARARQCLRDADFETLFIEELGWDRHSARIDIDLDGRSYRLTALAEKRGVQIFECSPETDGSIPVHRIRRRIDAELTKQAREHLVIFMDGARRTQVWQWVSRQPGKPAAYREHTYHRGYADEALLQKLGGITFALSEEEGLTLLGVVVKLKDAFDKEPVTKRFYDRFKSEHAAFMKFLEGIPDEGMQRWYVSVMLNRLMFIYFIQKKGFLDGDRDYLRARLAKMKERGRDLYYREFLCPLFFEGFAKRKEGRTPASRELLGEVPYLDGGLFQRHQIEESHGQAIRIADAAFERLFEFFEQYQWHLDDRPMREANEINPDVLGYIFEKYINQKEMGAYYTKEDITEYISKNTIIPYLFDAAREKCRIAFEGEHSVWELLRADPDRYIYKAVRKGVDLPLPPEIAEGIRDVSKRGGWNRPAPEEYALPTEIWREVVARRRRYEEVRAKLAAGEVRCINDLITYNLDIRQFAQDVIENSEGPELLRAFWHAIEKVTVLDPTCGSGAFLFAALNILERLYEACLERMEAFLGDLERSGERHRPEKYGDFRKVLERVKRHPNRRYFVLKSIVVNNLYGVDIMEEAVEICKLRLFLKLVAQVERTEEIEPLPDIDFNIRAGNTLVGYATYDQVKQAVGAKFDFDDTMARIEEKAGDLDRLFAQFREQQTELGMEAALLDKTELRRRLAELDEELDRFLATEYKVKVGESWDSPEYRKWHASHKPFHWFLEFYGTMKRGGFDVIIGNPPYVEYSRVRDSYSVREYVTKSCGNLYAMIMERSFNLISRKGRTGMIVPLSLACTRRMEPLRALIKNFQCWISCFDMRPASLFEGEAQRLSIALTSKESGTDFQFLTGGYRRWNTTERESLMNTINYSLTSWNGIAADPIPKISTTIEYKLLKKIVGPSIVKICEGLAEPIYVHRIVRYFIKALDFVPIFIDSEGKPGKSDDYKPFKFLQSEQYIVLCILNSTLFYWFWRIHSDGFHCGYGDVFLIPYRKPTEACIRALLENLARQLMDSFRVYSVEKAISTKAGRVRYQEFYPKESKPIIDEIDRVLAKHYDFTDEELDFIINYDIKYRMGRDGGNEDD